MVIQQWFPVGRNTRIADEMGTGMGTTDGAPHSGHLSAVGAAVHLLPEIFPFLEIAEWRSTIFRTERIPQDRGIRTEFLEIPNRAAFDQLPDSTRGYIGGDIFVLVGAGCGRLEMGDFQTSIRDMPFSTGPGWVEDNVSPEFRSDIPL